MGLECDTPSPKGLKVAAPQEEPRSYFAANRRDRKMGFIGNMALVVRERVTVPVHRANLFVRRMLAAAILATAACTARAETWQFGITPYLWLPNIEANGTADAPAGGGEPAFQVGPVDYLDNLDFVLMLAGEARSGSWMLRTDVIYLDFSNQRSKVKTVSGPGGLIEIPLDAGSVSSFTGLEAQATLGYWVVDQPNVSVEIFGGLRYLDIRFVLDWELDAPLNLLPQSGHIAQDADPLDVIAGANARFAIGNGKWFVPLHADIGTGGSSLTWQLSAGIGYSFSWGDLLAVYRHLDYEDDTGNLLEGLALSGPAIGASFRF